MSIEWLPERFTFAGTRVILNPEGRNYEARKRESRDDAGYVIDNQASERDLQVILKNGDRHMPNWGVTVRWDNGRNTSVNIKDLLIVENAFKEVTHYLFQSHDTIKLLADEDHSRIDHLIITERRRLREKRVFDKAYVSKHISDAYFAIGDLPEPSKPKAKPAKKPSISIDEELPF